MIMGIFLSILFLLVGFALLVKGADWFVGGSASIARRLKVPTLVIGLTIVAFGTSAPEASVSIVAAFEHSNDIALGNVVGSNIFNLLVVAGAAALISPIKMQDSLIKRDFPFALLTSVFLLVLALDVALQASANQISRSDGILLLLMFAIFLYYTIASGMKHRRALEEQELSEMPEQLSTKKSIIYLIVGLAGIIVGGKFVVDSATRIAQAVGLSEKLIGLTIVAIGTSLPELVTSVVASRKGENDIAMGNVVGSNIFNVLFVLGASAAIYPINVNSQVFFDLAVMLGVTGLAYVFCISKKTLNRVEGAVMIAIYIAYTVYIIIRN